MADILKEYSKDSEKKLKLDLEKRIDKYITLNASETP